MAKELVDSNGGVFEEFTDEQIEELANMAWDRLCDFMGENGPVNDVQIFVKELDVIKSRLDAAYEVAGEAIFEAAIEAAFS